MAARKKKSVLPKKSRARTPPYPAYPEWSTSKFWSFLRSGLRGTYNRWPPKWEILAAAKRPYQGVDKRTKWEYNCGECGGWFKQKEVSIDHIVPAGSLNCLDDIAGFVDRLFVSKEGLQLLCSTCHARKTKEERNKD